MNGYFSYSILYCFFSECWFFSNRNSGHYPQGKKSQLLVLHYPFHELIPNRHWNLCRIWPWKCFFLLQVMLNIVLFDWCFILLPPPPPPHHTHSHTLWHTRWRRASLECAFHSGTYIYICKITCCSVKGPNFNDCYTSEARKWKWNA